MPSAKYLLLWNSGLPQRRTFKVFCRMHCRSWRDGRRPR